MKPTAFTSLLLVFFLLILSSQIHAQSCNTGKLDERAAAFLDKNGKGLNMQTLMASSIEELRKDKLKDFLKLHEDSVQRIKITSDNIKVNVVKASKENNLMVIINFHAGGFIKPLLPSMEYEAMRLSKKFNAVVFDIDYRIAPEHKYPAAKHDAYAAYNWVKENAKQYGGDPEKIILIGYEAGANLAALTMHKARKENNHKGLKSVLLICPMLDNPMISFYGSYEDNATGYGLSKEEALFYTQNYLDKSLWFAGASEIWPVYENELLGMPPTLIITTEFDVLRDEGIAYGKKLEKAGNRSAIKCFPHQLHNFTGLSDKAEEKNRVYELMKEVIIFGMER
jgi:acetyl esterase